MEHSAVNRAVIGSNPINGAFPSLPSPASVKGSFSWPLQSPPYLEVSKVSMSPKMHRWFRHSRNPLVGFMPLLVLGPLVFLGPAALVMFRGTGTVVLLVPVLVVVGVMHLVAHPFMRYSEGEYPETGLIQGLRGNPYGSREPPLDIPARRDEDGHTESGRVPPGTLQPDAVPLLGRGDPPHGQGQRRCGRGAGAVKVYIP